MVINTFSFIALQDLTKIDNNNRTHPRETPLNSVKRSKNCVSSTVFSSLQSAIPSHPLNFAGLSSFCNDINAINEEFAGIPQVSAKIDELPAGAEVKNRYANVIPLPETRVLLQKINNDPLTEYINASYVRVSEFFNNCSWLLDSQSSERLTLICFRIVTLHQLFG